MTVFSSIERNSKHNKKLYTKINPEELTGLCNPFENARKEHHTDNDQNDSHSNLNIMHHLAIFSQCEGNPSQASAASKNGIANPAEYAERSDTPVDNEPPLSARVRIAPSTGPTHGAQPAEKN